MGAQMFDADLMNKAGIVSKTTKINKNMALVSAAPTRRAEYLRAFRILDEQDAVNRYRWFNIPFELSSQEIERLIYFKGQLVGFYYEEVDKFYLMPYALDGGLDFYGRYNRVHPVPMSDGTAEDGESKDKAEARYKTQMAILSEKKLDIAYDIIDDEDLTYEDIISKGVILRDYTNQIGQLIIPRWILNSCFVETMADIMCYCETAALLGTGVEGYRVDTDDNKSDVKKIAQAMYNAAISKEPYLAVTSTMDFQELKTGAKYQISDYLMTFQGVDNLRLSMYGIANGGVYEKKAHILESEQEMNNSNLYNAAQDGLSCRQHFCNIFNSIFGTSMWCEISENVIEEDLDQDGVIRDSEIMEEEPAEGGESDGK